MPRLPRRLRHSELLAQPVTSINFESLSAAEAGDIEILVLDALPGTELEGLITEACLAYVVLKREHGFLLCVLAGVVAEPALSAASASGHTGLIGPAHRVSARAVALGEAGEWVMAEPVTRLAVYLLDLESEASLSLLPLTTGLGDYFSFAMEDPTLFPLAVEVVAAAHSWLAGIQGERGASGYVTAAEDSAHSGGPPGPPLAKNPQSKVGAKAEAKAKNITLAALASQHAGLQDLVTALALQLQDVSAKQDEVIAAARAPTAASAETLRMPPAAHPHLRNPVSQVAPCAGHSEEASGRPGPSAANSANRRFSLKRARCRSAAWHYRRRAVDLQAAPGLSTRGTLGRQKLQAELAARDGSFFERAYSAAARRMYPASRPASALELCQKEPVMQRYMERYGGFSQHRDLGLIQWQLAQAMDLFAQGEARGAADLVSQLMVMLEQLSLDGGRSDLAWLLTLQHDPPASIFADHQALPSSGLRPFSPLADQKLVSTTLAYVRELETLATKRAEFTKAKSLRPLRQNRRSAPVPEAASRQTVGEKKAAGGKG